MLEYAPTRDHFVTEATFELAADGVVRLTVGAQHGRECRAMLALVMAERDFVKVHAGMTMFGRTHGLLPVEPLSPLPQKTS